MRTKSALCYSKHYDLGLSQGLPFRSVSDDVVEIGGEYVGRRRRGAPHGGSARYTRFLLQRGILLPDPLGHTGPQNRQYAGENYPNHEGECPMGERSDQITRRIEQTRGELGSNLQELETKVKDVTD